MGLTYIPVPLLRKGDQMQRLTELPKDLPVPVDDGACNHLLGQSLPSVFLSSTQGRRVELLAIPGCVVIYCYPMTGQPDIPLPDGWDEIPGARGVLHSHALFEITTKN